jgi:DNA-directed RNA polymerase specialized sigma24 family protein
MTLNMSDDEHWNHYDRARLGDTRSADKLVLEFRDLLARYFLRRHVSYADVDDMEDRTWEVVLRREWDHRGDASFVAIVLGVAKMQLREYWRRQQKQAREEPRDPTPGDDRDDLGYSAAAPWPTNAEPWPARPSNDIDRLLIRLVVEETLDDLYDVRLVMLRIDGYRWEEVAETLAREFPHRPARSADGVRMHFERNIRPKFGDLFLDDEEER